MNPLLELQEVSKVYRGRGTEVTALSAFSLTLSAGEFVAVRGPSGCGKSTLLMIAGGMLRPTSGTVRLGDRDLYQSSRAERSHVRADAVGFVFQLFHLAPYLNVVENVLLPQMSGQVRVEKPRDQAMALIESIGLKDRLRHKPSQLSAGERQRVALARALFKNPKLILADEPTGSLDPENAAHIVQSLKDYQDRGGAVLFVTHGALADDVPSRTIKLGQ